MVIIQDDINACPEQLSKNSKFKRVQEQKRSKIPTSLIQLV